MRLFASRKESKPDSTKWALWRWLDIILDGELYLSRLTLLRTPWFSVNLHWIHRPDPDRDMHDHPWAFTSFILRGWYKELSCDKPAARGAWLARCVDAGQVSEGKARFPVKERLVRWFNHKDTKGAHRITQVSPNLLTLVFTGNKVKSWGFYNEDTFKYTDWETYVATQQKAKM